MDIQFPSLNVNIIEELGRLYDELILIKRNQSQFEFKLNQKYLRLEKECNKKIEKQHEFIISLNKIIKQKNIKLDILYNLHKKNNDNVLKHN